MAGSRFIVPCCTKKIFFYLLFHFFLIFPGFVGAVSKFNESSLLAYFSALKPPWNGECFSDNPKLKDRFTWEELELNCQKWRAYNEEINVTENVAIQEFISAGPFTRAQKIYLNSLQTDLHVTVNFKFPFAVRKELRSLTNLERLSFWATVNELKNQPIDGVSKYDLIVILRHPHFAPGAQIGAAFLPWHREYLRQFEVALQQISPLVSLPYWDPTIDGSLAEPDSSLLWSDIYLGTSRGPVTTGPFAGWTFASELLNGTVIYEALSRNLSAKGDPAPMTPDDTLHITSRRSFGDFSACSNGSRLEQISRRVHQWVGGTMADSARSSRDPLYFMFHAYLDYLWEIWRRSKSYADRTTAYPRGSKACLRFHYVQAPMRPFQGRVMRNVDGLSDLYTQIYYAYQAEPTCMLSSSQCLSPHLYCDLKKARCTPKIKPGSACTMNSEACYQSSCINGSCIINNGNDQNHVNFIGFSTLMDFVRSFMKA